MSVEFFINLKRDCLYQPQYGETNERKEFRIQAIGERLVGMSLIGLAGIIGFTALFYSAPAALLTVITGLFFAIIGCELCIMGNNASKHLNGSQSIGDFWILAKLGCNQATSGVPYVFQDTLIVQHLYRIITEK